MDIQIPFQQHPKKFSGLTERWLTLRENSPEWKAIGEKWMTKESRALVIAIEAEGIRLKEMGIFDAIPNIRIIPLLETIPQKGIQKFMSWTEKVADALPQYVKTGFKALRDQLDIPSFSSASETNLSSAFTCIEQDSNEIAPEGNLSWRRFCLRAARIQIEAPNFETRLDRSFPSFQEAVVFALHHEASHASQAFWHRVPIMPPLQIHSSKNEAATTWVENAWARLMNVVPPEEHNVINNVQQRWREYYADVGGAFIHARAGYNTNYLDAFIAARQDGDAGHDTSSVLRRLRPVLDDHPIAKGESFTPTRLHIEISTVIAPQMAYDLVQLIQNDAAVAATLEKALSSLKWEGPDNPPGKAYSEVFDGQYPQLFNLIASVYNGPTLQDIRVAAEEVKITRGTPVANHDATPGLVP